MKIQYTGIEDFRELHGIDLWHNSQVKGFQGLSFPKGIPAEVDDEVGNAIVNNPAVYGSFIVVPEEETPVEEAPVEDAKIEKADKKSKAETE